MVGKACYLEERLCTGCRECHYCDLNPDKICDNCKDCLATDAEYRAIAVEAILSSVEMPPPGRQGNEPKKDEGKG